MLVWQSSKCLKFSFDMLYCLFQIRSLYHQKDLQFSSFRSNLFWNEDLHLFGNPGGKICWTWHETHVIANSELTSESVQHNHLQGSAKDPFLMQLFSIESFDSWVCYFGELRKNNLLNVAARNREKHFQSYLLNWLWHYDYNDSAK